MRMLFVFALSAALVLSANCFALDGKEPRDVFPGIGEYLYNGSPRNWSEAIIYCTAQKAELAVINSEAEKSALRTIMARNGAASIHLGFHDKYTEGKYITIKGDSLSKSCSGSQWAPGFPIDGDDFNCGGLIATGLVNTDCDALDATICEYPVNDYDLIPGFGYYKYYPEMVSWSEAWEVCQSEGAYLHVLNTVEEINALHQKYDYSQVWVGAHRLYATSNDRFVTVFNQPLEDAARIQWYPGFPNGDFLTHPYVASYLNRNLFTGSRTLVLSYICEKNVIL